MGVGTREMGFLYGQFRRLAGHSQVQAGAFFCTISLKYSILRKEGTHYPMTIF